MGARSYISDELVQAGVKRKMVERSKLAELRIQWMWMTLPAFCFRPELHPYSPVIMIRRAPMGGLEDLKSLLAIITSQEFNDGGWRFICRDDFTTFSEIGFLNAIVCALYDRIGELLEGRKQHLEATKYYDNSKDCYSALLPLVEEAPEEYFQYGDPKEMVIMTVKKSTTTAWMNMGLAYKYAGDLEECERCYKEGIALNPCGSQLHNVVTLYMNGYFPARVQQAKGILKQMKRLINEEGGTIIQQDLSDYHWDLVQSALRRGQGSESLGKRC